MSSTSCGTLRNVGTGAHSLVSLLINTPVPTPQFGWQPQLTEPQWRFRAMGKIGKRRERADQRNREPVACRLDLAHLRADVLREVRKRVALLHAALGGDFLVAAGEGNRLERHEGNLLGVVHREFHDRAHLIVVQVVDDRGDQDDFDARLVHVFDGAQFHVKQVAHLAVAIGVVADSVELQVGVAQASFERLLAILLALGELDAVGRGLHAVVADLARVANGVEKARVHRRLAAGELHGHLTARLDLQRVIEDFLNLFPGKFVNVANLVRVHEAGIAHHVAAVGEVHGEHGATPVTHGAGAMLVQVFVIVRGNVAAGEVLLDPVQELGVDGHHVFVLAVNRAFLDHPDFAVALDDLRLDFADLLAASGRASLSCRRRWHRARPSRSPGTASPSAAASRAWAWTSPTTSAAAYRTISE